MRLYLLGGIALASASSASATMVVTTFTGTVADAQGNVGAASPFGAIIAGQAYTLIYTIDDAVSGAVFTTGPYGKSVTGTGSVTAALTINGVTRTIGGQTTAQAQHKNAEPDSGRLFDRVLRTSQDYSYVVGGLYSDSYAQTSVGSYLSDYLTDGNYATPFTYTPVSTDSYFSNVHFNIFDFATNTQLVNVYLSLAPGAISSQVVGGAVPEPATWAMMIAGFGMIGCAARYRRRMRPSTST